MKYIFSYNNPSATHTLDITLTVTNHHSPTLQLQLPAWRPGRYQIQNFAKNILYFQATDAQGKALSYRKVTKDLWEIDTPSVTTVVVSYGYFAVQADAGGTFISDAYCYINPVTCCMYVPERMHEPHSLQVPKLPGQRYAGGLPAVEQHGHFELTASDYHHLADSPFLITEHLHHEHFQIHEHQFHIWVAGHFVFDWQQLVLDFERFTRYQISIFREFPESDYHFILWVLPQPFYHGVEHRNSTMMVLGPDTQAAEEMYVDLLGLASHELFHTWNICKIRPKELMPYDYTREAYFPTCFVAEGITTFYGDWALYSSGVFSKEQYLKELETRYKRHFENSDTARQSLIEASMDLWLDGYGAAVPGRTVSVYHKGAIAAQALDFRISNKFDGVVTLGRVMRLLWERFGRQGIGYTYADFRALAEEVAKEPLDDYFSQFIEGHESLWTETNQMLAPWGVALHRNPQGLVSIQ